MTYCIVLRSYGRGVVPNQTSPLLHQAREVVFQVFHELRGNAGHGEALDDLGYPAHFCPRRLQELKPRRRGIKKVTDLHTGPGRMRSWHRRGDLAARHIQSPGFGRGCGPTGDGKSTDRSYRGKRLAAEAQMADIFGPQALQKIPDDHPLYSAFFEFDGPPRTSVELNGWGDDLVHDYLKAIQVNGRIGVLYSNKDLGCEWDYDFRNKRWLKIDNTRFAVNIVVYAMTA